MKRFITLLKEYWNNPAFIGEEVYDWWHSKFVLPKYLDKMIEEDRCVVCGHQDCDGDHH